MITWIEFINQCISLPTGDDFYFFVENAINELYNKNISSVIEKVRNSFREANKNNNISTIAIGIRDCIEYCQKRSKNITNEDEKNKTNLFLDSLIYISDEIPKIIQECQVEQESSKEESTKAVMDSFDSKMEELQKKIASMEENIKLQNETIDSKAFQLIINTVSILGIFAAIVLTFNVGISFSTEVLQNFMQSSIYHSVLVVLLFGFIIGNVIFALFAFLRHVYKSTTDESFKNTIFGQIIKIFNIVLAVLFILNIICWFLGVSEFRDVCVDNRVQEYFSEIADETTTQDISIEETT